LCLSGKSAKTCQALFKKIFRYAFRANQWLKSARLTAKEGRSRSSRPCGEMRWTLMLRLTSVTEAYGEVVWSWRPDAGVKLRGSIRAMTVARKPVTGESMI